MSAEVGRNWDEAACLCTEVSGPGPGLTSQLQLWPVPSGTCEQRQEET